MEHCVKSNEKSAKLRENGNQSYAKREFFDAILKYNESLCYAENYSENAGLAYANRSAVYFEMKLYENSIENINLARSYNYPEKNLEILKKREEKCQELMKNSKVSNTNEINHLKLSHLGHKNLPSIASCLELKCDKKYGRHIITNKDLAVGEVVAIDESFCNMLQENFLYQRCANCFKSNLLNLIPCLGCNRGKLKNHNKVIKFSTIHLFISVMFCSQECSQNATKNFHKFECQIMQLITSSILNSNMRMALRTFFMSLALFDDSIENLKTFLDDQKPCTIFDFKTELNMKQKLLAINALVFDDSIEVNDTVFDEIFQLNNQLKGLWENQKYFIKKFLIKHTQIASLNYHEVYGWPLKRGGLVDPEISHLQKSLAYKRGVVAYGNGSFPFCALLNHSCAPNICKIFLENKVFVVVQRKIEASSQLFDNYGFSFTNVPRDFRQDELLKQYRFKCQCIACNNNFGLLPSLKICDKKTFMQAKKACVEMSSLNQKKAKQKFKEFAEIIQRGNKTFPSLEICSLTESFNACLEISIKPEIFFP